MIASSWVHRLLSQCAQRYGYQLIPAAAASAPKPLDAGSAQASTAPADADTSPPSAAICDVDTIVADATAQAAALSDEAAAAAYTSMTEVFERGLPDTKLFDYTPPPVSSVDLWTWIRSTGAIKTVIDIGANNGEYVEYLGNYFRPNAIYAFEPLTSCQPRLQEIAGQFSNMRVFQLALDDHAGEETFWENEYGPSSSLLHVSDIHKEAFPHTQRESATTVQVARLDDVLDATTLEHGVLIKIDVQGVEDRVIRGGKTLFSVADVVLIEMSFLALYDRQPIFDEINDALRTCGLRLVGIKDQTGDPSTGQPLFAHCFYRRDPAGA